MIDLIIVMMVLVTWFTTQLYYRHIRLPDGNPSRLLLRGSTMRSLLGIMRLYIRELEWPESLAQRKGDAGGRSRWRLLLQKVGGTHSVGRREPKGCVV
jgi:hypothetical protein